MSYLLGKGCSVGSNSWPVGGLVIAICVRKITVGWLVSLFRPLYCQFGRLFSLFTGGCEDM